MASTTAAPNSTQNCVAAGLIAAHTRFLRTGVSALLRLINVIQVHAWALVQ